MKVAERGQSWRIHITSKARNFNLKFRFRFNSTTFRPTWTLSSFRLSIVLKLRKFVLRINSKPIISPQKITSQPNTTQPKNRPGFVKARVMIIVQKFRASSAKNRHKIAAMPGSYPVYPKVQPMKLHNIIHIGLWVVGFLVSLAQSVIKNGQKGLMMVASAGVFVASILFKEFYMVKLIVKLAALPLLVAAIACYLFLNLDDNHWDYIAWSWSSLSKVASL